MVCPPSSLQRWDGHPGGLAWGSTAVPPTRTEPLTLWFAPSRFPSRPVLVNGSSPCPSAQPGRGSGSLWFQTRPCRLSNDFGVSIAARSSRFYSWCARAALNPLHCHLTSALIWLERVSRLVKRFVADPGEAAGAEPCGHGPGVTPASASGEKLLSPAWGVPRPGQLLSRWGPSPRGGMTRDPRLALLG